MTRVEDRAITVEMAQYASDGATTAELAEMFGMGVRAVQRRLKLYRDGSAPTASAASGQAAAARHRAHLRAKDRAALATAISAAGFAHAAPSLAGAVAIEICGPAPLVARIDNVAECAYDQRLGQVATDLERILLEAAAHYARTHGWQRRPLTAGPSPGSARLRQWVGDPDTN